MKSQKQCKGCVFWKSGAGGYALTSVYCCHYLLETGKRRIDQDGVCLSRTTSRQQVQQKNTKEKKENQCKKKVKAVEDNLVFESMTEAEKHYGLPRGKICKIKNDPGKMAKGQHFITV